MNLEEHPTVIRVRENGPGAPTHSGPLDAKWLKELLRNAGADDVGFVEIERPALDDQRADILALFPRTRALVSFVVRMNREPVRSPFRSASNLEFHTRGDQVNEVAQDVVRALEDRGIKALNPAMGFPMEMVQFPGKIWHVSHKPVAVAAGLGQMGIHRNVIHPKFGNFILLGTILVENEISEYHQAIHYNPCLDCKLCVAACPVGAISLTGEFNFSACYTHNYREFMGGFTDWTEQVVASNTPLQYRQKVTDSESASMWQSLAFGPNYKAAYCLAVCPAGEDVIGPYLDNKKQHLTEYVRPLQEKPETIYVLRNSDSVEHVAKRFPKKTIKYVGNSLRPSTLEGFLRGAPHTFQPGRAGNLSATYHFTFMGSESRTATFRIQDQRIEVSEGHSGTADLRITADTNAWLGFIRRERNIVWEIVRRRVRLSGPLRLLIALGKCFPG